MSATQSANFEVEVFYDGACPLCRREINLLRSWDRRQKIRFTDIMSPDFSAAGLGRSFDELMQRIHGRLPDGTIIEGVEVFRRLYAAVGFRRIVAISRWPGVNQLLRLGYRIFARNRLRLTGRCEHGSCNLPAREQQTSE